MSTGYKSKYEKSKFLRFLCAENGLHYWRKFDILNLSVNLSKKSNHKMGHTTHVF